jgi:DHA2 family multidrug resistance protein
VAFRVVQGATGGALQPLSQAVLLEAFPPEGRGKAMAFWGLGIVVAPILGPVLGGWLTDQYSWRWVFYVNLPVGIASLVMTKMFIFDPPYIRRQSTRIDFWGIGLLTLGIGALQIMLDKGQEDDWFASRFILTLAVISAVGLVLFTARELTTRDPVVNLRVLKDRTFSTGVFLMTMVGFVLFGSLVLLPILLQTVLGYPPLQAGIALAPRGMGSFLAMPIIGMILSRVSAKKLLALGMTGGGLTLFWLGSLNLNIGYWDIFWPQFVQGISLGLLFVPLTTVTMAPIVKEAMGNAASIFNLMRNLGGSVGIATATTILARQQQRELNLLGVHVSAYDPQTRALLDKLRSGMMAGGADAATAASKAYAALSGMVQKQASILSFSHVFQFMGIVFLLLLPLLLLMKPPPKQGGPAIAAH